jgi:siderophore synthetase component
VRFVIADERSGAERELAARVIDTLLREDYAGLSRRLRLRDGTPVLDLPAEHGAGPVLPLERDGFLADFRIPRLPAASRPPLTLDDVDSALRAISDPLDGEGVTAFAAECRQALAAFLLRERHQAGIHGRLARLWRAAPDALSGGSGLLGYEALAATMSHPAYPTSASRLGFSEDDSLRYAPEYLPEFALRWVAIPRSRLVTAGPHDHRPTGWPTARAVGLQESVDETHALVPVHPVTARRELGRALAECGLTGSGLAGAVIAPGASLRVTPTLSTRTVAVTSQPRSHLKLPLPTSTLGLLNRRSIKPGTLADGALVCGLLSAAARGDALLGGLLLADESSYAHAAHPYLGYLLRRLPSGLERCRIVPVAALLAPSPDSATPNTTAPNTTAPNTTARPLVIEELADWAWGGDLAGLLDAYLGVLFDVHVRLFVRYGIAIEAHQQNAALVLGPPGGAAGLRLLVKDFDGALVHLPRLVSALGSHAPAESAFADPRLVTDSDDALADVFITIIVHLCAGALAFGLADRGVAYLPDLLDLVRRKLTAALDRHADWPAASVLRARVLDADRLPGKSMVTAGTLVAKARTGAGDINKFYGTTGPNYLKDHKKADDNLRSCE